MAKSIEEVLARRPDLSCYLVHFTKSTVDASEGVAADLACGKASLEAIINSGQIEARSPFGMAKDPISSNADWRSLLFTQRCACFSEMPLEHVWSMLESIQDRTERFQPYGLAIPRLKGRRCGLNPVWYIDITPGHTWLTTPINDLVSQTINTTRPSKDSQGNFVVPEILKIAPFFEQMGSGTNAAGKPYRKEFWWEREWRSTENVSLDCVAVGFSPSQDINYFEKLVRDTHGKEIKFLDPSWSLSRMIGKLSGFTPLKDFDLA